MKIGYLEKILALVHKKHTRELKNFIKYQTMAQLKVTSFLCENILVFATHAIHYLMKFVEDKLKNFVKEFWSTFP